MGKAEITEELLDSLVPLVANEIGTKVVDGINWAILLDSDSSTITEYELLRKKIRELDYPVERIIRAYKAPNGIIYDIDSQVTRRLVEKLMKNSAEESLCKEMMENAYETRRNIEMTKLQIFIMKAVKEGKMRVSVALFNTNKGNKITYKTTLGTGEHQGKQMEISLKAFAIRHWDLQELNQVYLIPTGYKIDRIQVVEVLPTLSGVGFNLEIKKLEE